MFQRVLEPRRLLDGTVAISLFGARRFGQSMSNYPLRYDHAGWDGNWIRHFILWSGQGPRKQ
jgi:hypothetical protein